MVKKSTMPDRPLLVYAAVLLVLGLLVLSSAGVAVGLDRFQDSFFFIKRQILLGLLPGIVLFFAAYFFDVSRMEKIYRTAFVITLILLAAVFIPGIGAGYGTNAQSWINLFGVGFQPSEIAKVGLIFFLAGRLAENKEKIRNFSDGFFPALALAAIPLVLTVLQPDIGTAAILFGIIIAMFAFGGARWPHIAALLVGASAALIALIAIAPYRVARLTTFLHPELDPQGIGYQINQATLAIGSGGVFGLGLGHSRQKFQYLPEVHADSIFAVMAEELGFFVVLAFVVIYWLFIMRILRIGLRAQGAFSLLFCGGTASWLGLQFILNVGAMLGLLPLTGVPLPFVSHGGTALMMTLFALGIVASISKKI